MGISGTANPHRAFPVRLRWSTLRAFTLRLSFGLANGLGPTTQPPNAITESTSLECNPLRSGAAFAPDLPAWTKRGGLVRRLVFRSDFHARFLLRRIDRVAGGVNAFLIAMALGLGMLDLAYTIDKLLAALPPH